MLCNCRTPTTGTSGRSPNSRVRCARRWRRRRRRRARRSRCVRSCGSLPTRAARTTFTTSTTDMVRAHPHPHPHPHSHRVFHDLMSRPLSLLLSSSSGSEGRFSSSVRVLYMPHCGVRKYRLLLHAHSTRKHWSMQSGLRTSLNVDAHERNWR